MSEALIIMKREIEVSVVVCTYNRSALVTRALESLLAQEADASTYEVIVVDNNSTDDTRAVVKSMMARSRCELRYIFEGKQGLSYARNAGIAQARAPIITFTDDDVNATPFWVSQIKRAFDQHPEVDYIGGKVLPLWNKVKPPAWLTRHHWAPLALTDYGDQEVYVDRHNAICLIGANLSVRRSVFERVGLFASEFQRVKHSIGSIEDHEFQIRVWQAGLRGLYVPEVVVETEVQADRLTKAYHRRWHRGNGEYYAMMRLYEIEAADGQLVDGQREMVMLFGTPSFTYRELLVNSLNLLKATIKRDESSAFMYENYVREISSYIRKRRELSTSMRMTSVTSEVSVFVRKLISKKLGKIIV